MDACPGSLLFSPQSFQESRGPTEEILCWPVLGLGSYTAPTGQLESHWPKGVPRSPGCLSEDRCQGHPPAGGVTGAQVRSSQLPAHQNTWGLQQSPFFPLVSQPAPGRWLCLGGSLAES